jgi:RNA polymerase sigma-70 factor, ECF subfamily
VASFVETHGHAGDEGNFEALYTTYKSDVQRLASYLLRNANDAEDAAQTVFLNVLRALRQGVTPSDPRAWLLAITRNVCFSRHRAAAARPVQVELDFDEPAGPSDDETPSADEIVGALARLLPNQRTALILRDFRGVSRAEICDLMSLSPVAVEALLTRARSAFREELDAGEQPFECDETRTLVEQQLDGLITASDRHSLRSHLRHCAPCSTLARAVRSSRGKLAAILFWPVDLISRLAAAFSQAPSVVHVAAAVTSTAAVATIAIPVAVSNGPQLAHVEGRTAPGPASSAIVARPPAVSSAPFARVTQAVTRVVSRPQAAKPGTHTRVHTGSGSRPAVHKAAAASSRTATPSVTHSVRTGTRPATTSGSVQMPTHAPSASPASTARSSGSGISTPGTSSPRSSSPAVKPAAKPKARPQPKPKARRGSRRGVRGRHEPAPPDRMPSSTPPAASLQPSTGGTADAGSGTAISGSTPPASTSPARSAKDDNSSSSQSTGTAGTGTATDAGRSADTGDDSGDKHKRKKK